MPGNLRIKLRLADAEVEAEGTREDVEAILVTYWSPLLDVAPRSQQHDPGPKSARTKPRRGQSGRSQGGASAGTDPNTAGSRFDPTSHANAVKGRDDFHAIEEKVLHQKNWWRKTEMVLASTDEHISSGDIARVLKKLGTKGSQNRVSEAIARHSGKVLQEETTRNGQRIPVYTLTGKAKKEFASWLAEPAKQPLTSDDAEGGDSDASGADE